MHNNSLVGVALQWLREDMKLTAENRRSWTSIPFDGIGRDSAATNKSCSEVLAIAKADGSHSCQTCAPVRIELHAALACQGNLEPHAALHAAL